MYRTFNHGYCFYFARMLKSIYKNAKFVVADKDYAHISHIFILINDEVYDVNGKRMLKRYFVLTNNELEKIDINHNHIDDEVYAKFKSYFYEYLSQYMFYNNEIITKRKKYT